MYLRALSGGQKIFWWSGGVLEIPLVQCKETKQLFLKSLVE